MIVITARYRDSSAPSVTTITATAKSADAGKTKYHNKRSRVVNSLRGLLGEYISYTMLAPVSWKGALLQGLWRGCAHPRYRNWPCIFRGASPSGLIASGATCRVGCRYARGCVQKLPTAFAVAPYCKVSQKL